MKRVYKERFYPSEQQIELPVKSFGCCHFVWNNTLKYHTSYADFWCMEEKGSCGVIC
ncbi:helix-turn-helix domain-containing protein [Vibrio harveyi]